MSQGIQLFAATPEGAFSLQPPAGASELNNAYDTFPLGIYEGLRTLDRERLVALPEHVDRAERSIERLGWDYRLDRPLLYRTLAEVLRGQKEDSRVRFDVLAGPIGTPQGPARVIVGRSTLVLPSAAAYERGVGVELLRELERTDPLVKHAEFVVARRRYPLKPDDAYERLLVDADERVLECTASSFFGVQGGVVVTAGEDVLEGVTAQRVVEIAAEIDQTVEARVLGTSELPELDEAFLTSSIKGIVPVVRIDGEDVADGTPGPVTRALMERYAAWMHASARTADEAALQL